MNINQVSLRSANSAGLITVSSGSGLSEEEHETLMTTAIDVDFIKAIEGGRWEIENKQMIFYEDDNLTEVCRFDLFNKQGQPAEEGVYERKRT